MEDISTLSLVFAVIAFLIFCFISFDHHALAFWIIIIGWGSLFYILLKFDIETGTAIQFAPIAAGSLIGYVWGFWSGVIDRAEKIGRKINRWADED
ncbi:hypothetical protein [Paenibacillus marinisediminis]